MKKGSTEFANLLTIGGVSLMLGIANFALPVSLAIIGVTTIGCAILTEKEK